MRTIIILTLLALAPLIAADANAKKAAPAEKKTRVGVLDFTAKNVPLVEASIVNDIFRNELVGGGKFDVLDRKNMQGILEEQSFQQTGCTDSECAVKVGKMLNMEYMIYGILMKAGNKYFISVEMISVESSKIEKSARVQFEDMGKIEPVIVELVEQLTGQKRQQDINSFQFFIESFAVGYLTGFGSPDINQVPVNQNRYETPMGGDMFLRGRLFGKDTDVLKWTWMIGANGYYTGKRQDNGDQNAFKIDDYHAVWLNAYAAPCTSVMIRVGAVNVMLGGQLGYLYLMEYAKLYGRDYTQNFGMFSMGPVMMLELKLFDHFAIFVKSGFNFNFYSSPNDVFDTFDINYGSGQGYGVMGFAF
ncbi:MAG: hypothetical protein HZC28_16550 [Spirochaetes bacterium]|nr:hypothetical protein [Spirochaetota bacterium]